MLVNVFGEMANNTTVAKLIQVISRFSFGVLNGLRVEVVSMPPVAITTVATVATITTVTTVATVASSNSSNGATGLNSTAMQFSAMMFSGSVGKNFIRS